MTKMRSKYYVKYEFVTEERRDIRAQAEIGDKRERAVAKERTQWQKRHWDS